MKKEKKAAAPVSETAMVKVEVTTGPLKGTKIEKFKDLLIGRGPTCDILVPDDAISTEHSRIFRDSSGSYFVEDLGSANGTFVNNRRITERTPVSNGSKIRVGTTVIEYSEVDPVKRKAFKRKAMLGTVALLMLIGMIKMLQPDDPTQRYLADGNKKLANKEYADAIAVFQRILKSDPNSEIAKTMISQAKSQEEAESFLEQAKQAALEERYQDAEDICHKVIRLHPKHEEATELLNVVKMIAESQVATDAQNWPAAIRLIEKALESYPDSDVLLTGLERAKSEQSAEVNLQHVQTLIEEKKYDEAASLLGGVSESSAYSEPTQDLLTRVGKMAEAEVSFQAASKAYLEGDEGGAIKHIAQGLALVSDYPDLITLKKDIQIVSPMTKKLEGSDDLLRSEDVAAILEMVENCESVMNVRTESEEVGKVRARAADVATQLRDRLKEISRAAFDAANAALLSKDKTGALEHFRRAAQADPQNTAAVEAEAEIRSMLEPLAKEHFQQAIVHEEMKQIALAKEEYREVLKVSVPGDKYYDRAASRLKRLEDL